MPVVRRDWGFGMIKKAIARLLHIANTNPPIRRSFYRMKDSILKRYGTPDGVDWQHFEGKRCWSCDGTGVWESWYSDYQDDCYKCGGDGWYKLEKWVRLERIKFEKYTFHSPDGCVYEDPGGTPIKGFIEHRQEYGWHVDEAAAWLALLFDREYFRELIWSGTTYVRWPRYLGPMTQGRQIVGCLRRMQLEHELARKRRVEDADIPF